MRDGDPNRITEACIEELLSTVESFWFSGEQV